MKKLIKDGLAVLSFNYLSLAGNFVFATLLIRAGETQSYGQYVYLTNFQNVVAVALGFGLNIGLVRYKGSAEDFRQPAGVFTMATLIMLLGSWIVAALLKDVGAIPLGVGAVATGVTALALLQPIWQWHNELGRFWIWNFIQSLLRVLVLVAFYFFAPRSELLWPAIALVTWLVIASTNYWQRLHDWRMRSWTAAYAKLRGQASLPLWLSQIAVSLYGRLGILSLPYFGFAAYDLMSFGYVFGLFAAIIMIPALLQNLLMRPLFQQALSGEAVLGKFLPWFMITGLFLGWLMAHAVAPILFFITNHQNSDWAPLLRAFAPSIPILFVANPLGLALLSEKYDRVRTGAQMLTAGIYALLIWLIVPRFGIVGAALATTYAYSFLYLSFLVPCHISNVWGLRSKTPFLLVFFLISYTPWLI